MKRLGLLLTLALATSAAPLAAQQADSVRGPMPMHDHMMGMMGPMMGAMMGPMMRTMAFMPDHLLARKDALELTAQQVTRITALRDAAKTAHDAAQTEMQTHIAAMAETMKTNAPDTTALKQHFQAALAAMSRAHWAMLSSAAQARAVLTDGQRGRVDGWADMMEMHDHEMMHPHGDMEREDHHS